MRILQVDAISNPINQSNVRGLSRAYSRVAELHTFDYRKEKGLRGLDRMNERLVSLAIELKPDLVHLEKCELVKTDSVRRIRESTTAKLVYVFPDYRPSVPAYVTDACPYVDWSLYPHQSPVWFRRYREAGCGNAGFWTRGVDPGTFRPHRQLERKYDLVMMANRAGRPVPGAGQGKRDVFLLDLARAGLDVHLFGNGNRDLATRHERLFDHAHVDLGQFAEAVSAARIALAFNSGEIPMYCSWRRLFNTMASGCFIMVHYFPGLESVLEDHHHLVWFENTNEAVELIEYYLAHDEERETVARQGREEVIARHTWDIRVERMLNLAFRNLDEPKFWRT